MASNTAATEPPLLEPELLGIDPALTNAKERNNLSGAACAGRSCLLVGDEKRYARFFTLAPRVLAPTDSMLHLLPDGSDETDAEGIAYAGGHFFIVGSHSRTKDGDPQESRHFIYRVPIDAQTGMPGELGTETSPSSLLERRTLDPLIAAHPLLSQHLAEAPGDTPDGTAASHGVNIEGIAVDGDNLFVGFRGPVDADGAVILQTSVNAVFGGTAATAQSHRVRLGGGQGIRDLAAVGGGILILSGPERRRNVDPRPELFFWSPNTEPVLLGRLARSQGDDNPEAIAVLEETAEHYRLLVLWDGDAGGIPMIVNVPKRR